MFGVGISGVLWLAGCGSFTVPDSFAVPLPDGQKPVVQSGVGPGILANSTWAVFQTGDTNYDTGEHNPPEFAGLPGKPGPLIARIEFGAAGQLTRITDIRVFAPDTIGDSLIVDSLPHGALFPGSAYIGTSYGTAVESRIGFVGFAKFLFGPVTLAEATLSAIGTLNADRSRFEGMLILDIHLTPDGESILGNNAEIDTNTQTRPVVAIREG